MVWPTETPRIVVGELSLASISGFQPTMFGPEDLWLIPYIHHAFADRSRVHVFPDIPLTHKEQGIYWEGAYYLITMALGWSNPVQGLGWWLASGCPEEEPVLHLLKHVFNHRGQIERLDAWLRYQDHSNHMHGVLARMPGVSVAPIQPGSNHRVGSEIAQIARRWPGDWESTLPLGLSSDKHELGSYNELHLGHISWMAASGQLASANAYDLRKSARQPFHASVVIADPANWYGAMFAAGRRLKDSDSKSWKIDVVVKNWGHMGTWRRSRITGLWFLGSHRTHVRGN